MKKYAVLILTVISILGLSGCSLKITLQPSDENDDAILKILEEDGYTMEIQEEQEVPLSIPKAVLPDSIYSEDGHEFADSEIIAYKDDTSTIYLKSARYANEGNDKLYFCFEILYDLPSDSGTIVFPYIHYFYDGDRVLRDGDKVFDGAVRFRGSNWRENSEGDWLHCIWFYVSTEALKQAEETVEFDVTFNRITYLKNPQEENENI